MAAAGGGLPPAGADPSGVGVSPSQEGRAALAALRCQPEGPTPPAGDVTSEYVQALLEENQCIIVAVLDALRAGRAAECAALQRRLQANLLWLASVADHQTAPGAVAPRSATARAAQAARALPKPPAAGAAAQQQGAGGSKRGAYWSAEEHELFLASYGKNGKNLNAIAKDVGTRTPQQVRTHLQKWLIKEGKKRKKEADAAAGTAGAADGAAAAGGAEEGTQVGRDGHQQAHGAPPQAMPQQLAQEQPQPVDVAAPGGGAHPQRPQEPAAAPSLPQAAPASEGASGGGQTVIASALLR